MRFRYLVTALMLTSVVCCTKHLAAQTIINVLSYGAMPDDGYDDLPAIRAAISALPTTNAELVFEGGTYDLYPVGTLGVPSATAPGTMFDISSKTNIVVVGNGSTLMCHEFDATAPSNANYYNLFNFYGCTNLEIRDLTVNMSRLPFTMGACTGIIGTNLPLNQRQFTVTVDPVYLPTGTSLSGLNIHTLMNWRNGLPNGQRFFYVPQKDPPVGGDFKVSGVSSTLDVVIQGQWNPPPALPQDQPGYKMMIDLPDPTAPHVYDLGRLALGDDVVLAHQLSKYITFYFADCQQSFLSNVTVHSWPGMAVNMLRDTDVVIDGLQVIPDPQRPWPVSINSDAIHLTNLTGILQVHDCHLEGMLDDGFNAFGDLLVPASTQRDFPGALDLNAKREDWTFAAQSVWEFYDSNMIPLGTRVLSQPSTNRLGGLVHELNFSSLPTPIAYACNLSQFPTSIEIMGTTVKSNRGNGLLLRRNTVVENCSFVELSGSGVNIGPGVGYFYEGPGGVGGSGISVAHSTFQSCNRGWGLYPYEEGTINIRTAMYTGSTWTTGPVGSIANVQLLGLTFLDSGGSAITARSCELVSIEECTIGSCSDLWELLVDPQNPLGAGQFAAKSLLFFHEARDIGIYSNELLPTASFVEIDRWWPALYGYYTKSGNVGF